MAAKKQGASKSKKSKSTSAEKPQDGAAPVEANAGGANADDTNAAEANTESAPAANTGPTLTDVAEGYIAWLDKDGAGDGTLSSYRMELKLALRDLGEATPLADLTSEKVGEFFASDTVTKTRHGKHKAKATIDKTRRVLRLALMWAQDEKLIEVAPIPSGATKRTTLKAV